MKNADKMEKSAGWKKKGKRKEGEGERGGKCIVFMTSEEIEREKREYARKRERNAYIIPNCSPNNYIDLTIVQHQGDFKTSIEITTHKELTITPIQKLI